jgi:hypothetical protein
MRCPQCQHENRPGANFCVRCRTRFPRACLQCGTEAAAGRVIACRGCISNEDQVIGRGRLPAERMWLRLERSGSRARALCSVDGDPWYSAGEADFPTDGPVEVGLYAIGAIDCTIDHGAYPEGTAIRFEWFEVWGP